MAAKSIVTLAGSFAGTGVSANRTFRGSAFLLLDGDADADATVAFEFSDDGGATWHGLSVDLAKTRASWVLGASENVGIYVENEIAGRLFRFNCTAFADGVVTYALTSRG